MPEAVSGDQFKGLNKRQESTDISPDESMDCTNAFYVEERIGLMGPRKGKSFVNANPFTANVMGIIPFNLPLGSDLLIATQDGTIVVGDSPGAVTSPEVWGTYVALTGGSTLLTLNHPAVTGTATDTFSSTLDTNQGTRYLRVVYEVEIDMDNAGSGAANMPVELEIGVVVNNINQKLFDINFTANIGNIASFMYNTGVDIVPFESATNPSGMYASVRLPSGWDANAGGNAFIKFKTSGAG